MRSLEALFNRLDQSSFRRRFRLNAEDLDYLQKKGMAEILTHAETFVANRLAPAEIPNDGKQTPMCGHPVFVAQHATATCCRGCLHKWHQIPLHRALTLEEQAYVVVVIEYWLAHHVKKPA